MSKVLFKSKKPVDVVIYGGHLTDYESVSIFDDYLGIGLEFVDKEMNFYTTGCLSVLKLKNMDKAIDNTNSNIFYLLDEYNDFSTREPNEYGMFMIKNFVGKIEYAGVTEDDYSGSFGDCKLIIPVQSNQIKKLDENILEKMYKKWQSYN